MRVDRRFVRLAVKTGWQLFEANTKANRYSKSLVVDLCATCRFCSKEPLLSADVLYESPTRVVQVKLIAKAVRAYYFALFC